MPPIASPPRRGWGKNGRYTRTLPPVRPASCTVSCILAARPALFSRSLRLLAGGRVQVRRLIADQLGLASGLASAFCQPPWRRFWRLPAAGSGFSRQVCCLSARPGLRFFTSAGLASAFGSGLASGFHFRRLGLRFADRSRHRLRWLLSAAQAWSAAGLMLRGFGRLRRRFEPAQAPAPPPEWSPAAWLEQQQALPQAVGFRSFLLGGGQGRGRFGRGQRFQRRGSLPCPASLI